MNQNLVGSIYGRCPVNSQVNPYQILVLGQTISENVLKYLNVHTNDRIS